jgi:hypothetical protein
MLHKYHIDYFFSPHITLCFTEDQFQDLTIRFFFFGKNGLPNKKKIGEHGGSNIR